MEIGTVTGKIWATRKDAKLEGQKLLIVQTDSGRIVASDTIGAGEGDTVLITKGSGARITAADIPIDAAIVGIIDK